MQKYTREYFNDKVLILRRQEQLQEVLDSFDFELEEIKVKTFPMLVYKGLHESINISEITESNLNKLKCDKEFSKRIIELI